MKKTVFPDMTAAMAALLLTAFMTCASAMTRRALTVFIGEYPEESGWNRTAADNDKAPVLKMLENNGFLPSDIICLTDRDAIIVGAWAMLVGVPTGKTSDLLGASSALILNALKELAGIDHNKHVISPEALRPIQTLKTQYLGSKNPRLHSDETLIALSISAADNEDAKLALQQIPKLKGCQVHTSVLLSQVDILEFRKLGVELTCEPKSEHAKKLQK